MNLSNQPKVTRRDFTRLGALGLAAQFAPSLAYSATPDVATDAVAAAAPEPLSSQAAATSSSPKVGYAIIGLGRIAGHFMDGIQNHPNSKVTGLVSGHPEKAAAIAAKYGVPKSSIYSYENIEAIHDNKEIQAVYVALPNSMHAEYTIRSAKAGKHVLCEKPMAANPTEAEAMIDAAKAANVKLMIAYRLHFEPTNLRAIQLLRDGAIGKIQSIQSTYGFSCGPEEWRLKKALAGGGPLMDVGIYCLNATRYLTGEEPSEFSAFAYSDPNDPRFKEVEESLNWITKFPSGIVASCNTTYGGFMDGGYYVSGSQGWLEAKPAFNYEGLRLRGQSFNGKGPVDINEPNPEKDPIHFTRQAAHFSDCILNNKTPKTPGEEGLRDMKYMKEIYHSAGIQMS